MTDGSENSGSRLAAVERELLRLRYRHDIAMSAFLFEEATALGKTIAELERERQRLAAALPARPVEPAAEGGVPLLVRPRRQPRRAR